MPSATHSSAPDVGNSLALVKLTTLMERTSGNPEVKIGLIDGRSRSNIPTWTPSAFAKFRDITARHVVGPIAPPVFTGPLSPESSPQDAAPPHPRSARAVRSSRELRGRQQGFSGRRSHHAAAPFPIGSRSGFVLEMPIERWRRSRLPFLCRASSVHHRRCCSERDRRAAGAPTALFVPQCYHRIDA
jgi:hypothetical protein